MGSPETQAAFHEALRTAHALVAQGQPLQALRVVAELLQALGLEREAGESIARVQQALAAGSSSAAAADELAGLLSLVSLQPQGASGEPCKQPVQPWQEHWQQQQQQPSSADGMDIEGGTGPGPPTGSPMLAAAAASVGEQERITRLTIAAEGASYVCQKCGGVVAVARQAAHEQSWCPSLHGGPS
ncbi:hypothetical protein ABPG77_001510 [Micractinium sp. CCAP 211/92]